MMLFEVVKKKGHGGEESGFRPGAFGIRAKRVRVACSAGSSSDKGNHGHGSDHKTK